MAKKKLGEGRTTVSFTLYNDGMEKFEALRTMLGLDTTMLMRRLIDEAFNQHNPEVHLKRLEEDLVRINKDIAATKEAIPKYRAEKERLFRRVRIDSFTDYNKAVWVDRSSSPGYGGRGYLTTAERKAHVAEMFAEGKIHGFDSPDEAFEWFEAKVPLHMRGSSDWAEGMSMIPEDSRKEIDAEYLRLRCANNKVEEIEKGTWWSPQNVADRERRRKESERFMATLEAERATKR